VKGRGGSFLVSVTIVYRHRQRPDEVGMTVVVDEANVAAMKDQLKNQGFLVTKIETAPFRRAIHQHQSD
jgi:hypothetical protein